MIIGYRVRKHIGCLFDPLNGTFQLHSAESSPCLQVPAGMEMLKYAALYNNTWLPPTKLIVFRRWWSIRDKDLTYQHYLVWKDVLVISQYKCAIQTFGCLWTWQDFWTSRNRHKQSKQSKSELCLKTTLKFCCYVIVTCSITYLWS